MDIKFECPQCHAELHVEDKYVGKATNCPKCGREFNIPDEATAQLSKDSDK